MLKPINKLKLSPFRRLCVTIGELPTSFIESMSYYELLAWFCRYLQETVIPAINGNALAVKELQEKYIELKEYVDKYFENLDVQEEINNKLDEMAESGQLADIIAQYLQLKGVLSFDNINSLIEADNVVNGSVCRVLGNNSYKDGNGAYYKVRTKTPSDIIDDYNILHIESDNTLIAERIKNYGENLQFEGATIGFVSSIVDQQTLRNLGDCSVINSSKNIILDIGLETTANTLINYLHDNDITKIDYIIISHYHNDHIGGENCAGLEALLNDTALDFSNCQAILPHKDIDYNRFLPNGGQWLINTETILKEILSNHNIPYIYPSNEERIELGVNEYLEFYNIGGNFYNNYYDIKINAYGDETNETEYNNFSMITCYSYYDKKTMFAGDIQKEAEDLLYHYFTKCDLLKIEHHGLNLLASQKYLNQLQPLFGVICNHDYIENDNDFTSTPTVNAILSKKARLYSTRNNLSVKFKITPSGILPEKTTNDKIGVVGTSRYGGEIIPVGANLDNYTTPGVYNSVNHYRSETLINPPLTSSGFRLVVTKATVDDRIIQEAYITNNQNMQVYMRATKNGVFGEWRMLLYTPYQTGIVDISNECTTTGVDIVNAEIKSKFNGCTRLLLEFTTNQVVSPYTNVITIPREIVECTGTNVNIAAFDSTDGTFRPFYTRTDANNVLAIRNRAEIPEGHTILLCDDEFSDYLIQ